MWASTTAAKARSRRARSPGATSRQAGNASWARAMAASVWASVAAGTSRNPCPVAGLMRVVASAGLASSVEPVETASPTSVEPVEPTSHPLERALKLPVGHRRVVRAQLHVGHVRVVVHHLVAEGAAGDPRRRPGLTSLAQGVRHVRLVGVVGVALELRFELELLLD